MHYFKKQTQNLVLFLTDFTMHLKITNYLQYTTEKRTGFCCSESHWTYFGHFDLLKVKRTYILNLQFKCRALCQNDSHQKCRNYKVIQSYLFEGVLFLILQLKFSFKKYLISHKELILSNGRSPSLNSGSGKDKVEKMDKPADHQEAAEGCDEGILPSQLSRASKAILETRG